MRQSPTAKTNSSRASARARCTRSMPAGYAACASPRPGRRAADLPPPAVGCPSSPTVSPVRRETSRSTVAGARHVSEHRGRCAPRTPRRGWTVTTRCRAGRTSLRGEGRGELDSLTASEPERGPRRSADPIERRHGLTPASQGRARQGVVSVPSAKAPGGAKVRRSRCVRGTTRRHIPVVEEATVRSLPGQVVILSGGGRVTVG
jgi:hypothetical protein